jgi:hypothetical protein
MSVRMLATVRRQPRLAARRFDLSSSLPALLVAGACIFIGWSGLFASNAAGGLYTVRSCDAAPPTHDSTAWEIQSGSVNSYRLCPTVGGGTPNGRGMVTRMVGRTFTAGEYSRLWFFAPWGTQITRLDWAGRAARDTPSWQVEIRAQGGISDARILGWPAQPGASGWQSGFENIHPIALSAPAGTTRLMQNTQCGAGSCGSGATLHTYHAVVTLRDSSEPAISLEGLGEAEWVRSDRTITFHAVDNVGIKSAHLYIDGHLRGSIHYHCDYTRPVPCSNHSGNFGIPTTQLSPGSHRIDVLAYDASDTAVKTGRTIRVDNAPPAQVTPSVAGGEGWRNRNGFAVGWSIAADTGSPIVGAIWQLCRPGRVACTTHQVSQPSPTGIAPFGVASDGTYELRVVLRDQAGNIASLSDARPVMLRLDREAPGIAIDSHDPNTPIRAAATVSDGLSGLAGGQVELRRVGAATWRELPTSVEGHKLIAEVDDERFPDGRYELRARAVDHAGNETSTGAEASGARALRQLPVRIKTRLRAGRRVVRIVTRSRGRDDSRRRVRRRVTRLRRQLTVAYKRYGRIHGVLTNPDGQPLHDVPIEVSARPNLPGAGFAAAGLIRTDRHGRFSYKVRGSVGRTLRFRYAGTKRIRPATADVAVDVPASSTFRLTPKRILNGETVTFSGRVRGGSIPATGKLIELRKWTGRQWAPFRVVRSDSTGRWRHTEPVLSVSGLVVFRLRAYLPVEAGFPYASGRTPARTLLVRGL